MTSELRPSPESVGLDDVDPNVFRATMSQYASGVTVIAGYDANKPIGFTCQSFHSVSLTPPLISFNVMKTSTTYPAIRQSGRFSVNVLAQSQDELSNQFARRGTDKWAGVDWEPTENHNPVLLGTLMWLDCGIQAEYEAGDHYIVIGRVFLTSPIDWHDGEPLIFYKGQYRHLGR